MKAAWLRSVVEPALSPDFPIIDPHHHFWDEGPLTERLGRYMPQDFWAAVDRSGHRVVATVYLECMWKYRTGGPPHLRCVGETEAVEAVATEYAARGGDHAGLAATIVGYADLRLGDAVAEVLEAHQVASPSRLRGIRYVTAADRDDPLAGEMYRGALEDPAFRDGLAHFERLGLTFETWCLHTQLAEFAKLAKAFPAVPMVLDHLATPLGVGRFQGRRAEVFEAWRKGIDEVARLPNVVMKLGGFGMPTTGFNWHEDAEPPDSETVAAAYRPYVLQAIEAFSPQRCMFESNFAVDGMAYGYGTVWNAFKRIASGFSAEDQSALFRNTAARVYAIEAPTLG